MVDDQEDLDEDGDYEPTEEEKKHARLMYELAERYPTFLLLMKALQRHRRFQRLRKLRAPPQIIEKEEKMREEAFDTLADAFPFDTEVNVYHLPDIIGAMGAELRHPHSQGGTDA